MLDQQITTSWQYTGAWSGGTVSSVAINRQSILAASRAGIFRSSDDGAAWQRCNKGLGNPSILTLARAAGQADLLFAGSEQGRLYRSSDGGLQWQELTAWAGLGVITALCLSPAFAEDQTIFAATMDGPFRSQDGGNSWESATFGLVDVEVLSIALDPDFSASNTLWIGTANGGLYRSRNGGRSWRDAGSGLPDQPMQCLIATAWDGRTLLFVGAEEAGIYRSVDGVSWEQVLSGTGVHALAAFDDSLELLAGSDDGILLSEDAGDSWQVVHGGDFMALSFALDSSGRAMAGSWQSGVYVSHDRGRRWQQANGTGQFLTGHAPPLVIMGPDDELVAADVDGGWVMSTNRGVSWTTVPIVSAAPVDTLVRDGDTLLAAAGHMIYRRPRHSVWEAVATPFRIVQMAVSPDSGNDRTYIAISDEGTLHRSIDGGAGWQILPTPWREGIPLNLSFSPQFSADGVLYAVTAQAKGNRYQLELWQSADRAEHWSDLAAFEADVAAVSVLPLASDDRTLFVATQHRILRFFEQAGGELAVEQEQLEAGVRIIGLAADTHGRIYAATSHGVWTRNHSHGWQRVGAGLEDHVVALFFAQNGELGVMSLGGAVWWLVESAGRGGGAA